MYDHTRQAYYRYFEREQERAEYKSWLLELIKRVRRRLPQIGGKNLWKLLRRIYRILGLRPLGRDRLARFLRENAMQVRWPRRRKIKTTYSGHQYAVQPNRFRGLEITAPGQALVADITYIDVRNSHAYLFLVTDAFSRMIVGYKLAESLRHDGAVDALQSALENIPDPKAVIHHSDRGIQYCCHDFLDEIRKWDMQASMTDGDHCAQNALAECMNGILKRELLLGLEFPSFQSAKRAVDEAVFTYNNLRIHGSLRGQTPAEVHHGWGGLLDLWIKELVAFWLPIPKAARFGVNSI